MTDPVSPELEDRRFTQALGLAHDIHDDVAAVHRALRAMDRLELEQVACVLAAMVDPLRNMESMAWWNKLPSARRDES